MTKTAVLVFEDGGIQVVKGVHSFEVVVRPPYYDPKDPDRNIHKYIKLEGIEGHYSYVDTFFAPVKTYMFFDNEDDIVYDENKVCIGYKIIKYFDEEKN